MDAPESPGPARPAKSPEALLRRAKRNQRKAWAMGYMTGVCTLLRPGDRIDLLGAATAVGVNILRGLL